VEEPQEAGTVVARPAAETASFGIGGLAIMSLAWLAVGAPLAWGVWVTLLKTAAMFH